MLARRPQTSVCVERRGMWVEEYKNFMCMIQELIREGKTGRGVRQVRDR